MTTNAQQEIRELAAGELDTVTGGADCAAWFEYGDLKVVITADASGWWCYTQSGSYSQELTGR